MLEFFGVFFFFFAACRLPTETQSQVAKCAADFLDSKNGEPWSDEAHLHSEM